MAGEVDGLRARGEPVQRGHVVAHGAVRRRHDRGRPSHHVIAGKQHVGAAQRVRHVVRRVAGGGDRLQRPAVALDDLAMGDPPVRHEFGIAAGIEALGFADVQRPRRPVRPLAIGDRPGRRLDLGRRRRMVAMGVGDDDVGHRLAAHRVEQRIDVLLVEGTGIDDGDLAAPDDVAQRPLEGERARIVDQDAPHAGRDLLDHAGGEVEGSVEGDVVSHGSWDYAVVRGPSYRTKLGAFAKVHTRSCISLVLRRGRRSVKRDKETVSCRAHRPRGNEAHL